MRAITLFLVVLVLAGCTYYPPGLPPEDDQRDFQSKMNQVQPGTPEGEFLGMFTVFTERKTRQIGIVDIEKYTAEEYEARTYWIGYWHTSSYGLVEKRLVSVGCVNGLVDNIYWP